MNESMSVKGWLEDHDFALGKVHGKNEPIWTDFTAQTVTLSAILLVKAHPIPQNAKWAFYLYQKLHLLKIFKFSM